jgi:hypothetical protein
LKKEKMKDYNSWMCEEEFKYGEAVVEEVIEC